MKKQRRSSINNGTSSSISISSRTHCGFSSSPSLLQRPARIYFSLLSTVNFILTVQIFFLLLLLFLSSFFFGEVSGSFTCRFDTDRELLLKNMTHSEEESVSMNMSSASSSSGSKRSASSLTSEATSSDDYRAHNLPIITLVARCHEMKFKVYSSV